MRTCIEFSVEWEFWEILNDNKNKVALKQKIDENFVSKSNSKSNVLIIFCTKLTKTVKLNNFFWLCITGEVHLAVNKVVFLYVVVKKSAYKIK